VNLVDLSGSVLAREAVNLAAWKSRESITSRPEQYAPATRPASDCRGLACGIWILTAGCLLRVHARNFPIGRQTSRPTSSPIFQYRQLNSMRSYNCSETIWHRFSTVNVPTCQHSARPVQNAFGRALLPLHPAHSALASIPSRRR